MRIICGMIKGQDILMLAALMGEGASELPYSELGHVACLSASEAHASVKRLQESALINSMHRPLKRNVEEFLFHGSSSYSAYFAIIRTQWQRH